MAGALKKTRRKPKQKPFAPSRAARIETVEDEESLFADPEFLTRQRQRQECGCRRCGCTQDQACWDEARGEPCHWTEPDLCSTCAAGQEFDCLGCLETLADGQHGLCANCHRQWRAATKATASYPSPNDCGVYEDCDNVVVPIPKTLGARVSLLISATTTPAVAANDPRGEKKKKPLVPPGLTSTVTPAGIAAHDPSVVPPAPARIEDELLSINVDAIQPSPTNPRKHFDEAKLEELAASIKSEGVIEPLIVRRFASGRYELVAGERRWRAAKLAGLATVPAIVRELSNNRASIQQTIENLQREGLDPIEEAEGFALLLRPIAEGGGGFTQTSLAEKLGCTQPHISNRVRLLELPEEWRERVHNGVIGAAHARELLRFAAAPSVLAGAAEMLESGGAPSHERWIAHLNSCAVRGSAELTRKVAVFASDSRDGKRREADLRIESDDPRWEELRVIDVQRGDRVEQRALNRELAKRILSERAKAWYFKHAKPKEQSTAKHAKAKEHTAAAVKAAARERERLRGELEDLAVRWRLHDAADCFAKLSTHDELMRLLLFCWLWVIDSQAPAQAVLAKKAGIKGGYPQRSKMLRKLLACEDVDELAAEQISALLLDWATEHSVSERPADVEPLLPSFNAGQAWSRDLMGPLTEEYFEKHSETQLRELCEEWDLDDPELQTAEKPDLIAWILESHKTKPLPLPAELAELVQPAKRRRK